MNRLRITIVKAGSVAESLGLKPDDILDTLAGVALSTPDLLPEVLSKQAGNRSELTYYRNGEKLSLEISSPTLGVVVVDQDLTPLLAIWGMKERAKNMVVTTAPSIEGFRITETLDVISSECAFGMNIFKDFFASVTDIIGGRSGTTQKVLRDARRECLLGLKEEAAELGADAIIGIDLDYSEFSGGGKSMLFVVATGTAVKVMKA